MSSGVLASVVRGQADRSARPQDAVWRVQSSYLLLLFLVAVALLPLLWMVSTSLKPGVPRGVQPVAAAQQGDCGPTIPDTWNRVPFPGPLANTMFITAFALFGSIALRFDHRLRVRQAAFPGTQRLVSPS